MEHTTSDLGERRNSQSITSSLIRSTSREEPEGPPQELTSSPDIHRGRNGRSPIASYSPRTRHNPDASDRMHNHKGRCTPTTNPSQTRMTAGLHRVLNVNIEGRKCYVATPQSRSSSSVVPVSYTHLTLPTIYSV